MSSSEGVEPHNENSVHVVSPEEHSLSEGEFSGFDDVDIPVGAQITVSTSKVGKKPLKSVIKVPKSSKNTGKENRSNSKKSDGGKKNKQKSKKNTENPKSKRSSLVDLENLSKSDIENLRKKLGLSTPNAPSTSTQPRPLQEFVLEDESSFVPDYLDEEEDSFPCHARNRPNIHVEVNASDISDSEIDLHENFPQKKNMSQSISKALFGSDSEANKEDEWQMPKLKASVRGAAISPSLASLINTASTSLCDTESLVNNYHIPENCDMLAPPLINQEIWKILDKKSRSYDRLFVEIQTLVAAGMVPIIKLVEHLKESLSKNEKCKQLLSDSLTLFGQVQYHLSLRRRYLIRPSLKAKYKNLCNQSVPVTSQLFGDEISKEIKNCEAGVAPGLPKYDYGSRSRGRGNFRNFRRGRFHPYANQGYNYQQDARGRYSTYFRGGARGKRRPSATATSTSVAPNEQL